MTKNEAAGEAVVENEKEREREQDIQLLDSFFDKVSTKLTEYQEEDKKKQFECYLSMEDKL